MVGRKLTRRETLAAAGGITGAGLLDAWGIEPRWLDTSMHDVPVEKLPRDLEGFKVAQITDAHLMDVGVVEERILETIRQQDVQVVALTGDIIDSPSRFGVLNQLCSELAKTEARIVATLGNWEHWGNVPLDVLRDLYSGFGGELLVNEQTVFHGIAFSGTDDATSSGVSFARSVVKTRADARILLTHSPAILDHVPRDVPQFDLAMAGHTHGGQVRLSSAFVPFVPPGSGRFVAGWYETSAGRAYVSRGTGTSIAPVRFTCRPELPIFRLCQG